MKTGLPQLYYGYEIVCGENTGQLEMQMLLKLQEGFTLIGGVSVTESPDHGELFYQAIAKPAPKEL